MAKSIFEAKPDPKETAAELRNIAISGLGQLRGLYDVAQQLIWHNRDGFTPQQVFDALGDSAASLVALSQAVEQIVNQFAPEASCIASCKPEAVTLTAAEDGTVKAELRK